MALTTLMVFVVFGAVALGMLAVAVALVVGVVHVSRPSPRPLSGPPIWRVTVFADNAFGSIGGSLGSETGTLELREGHLGYCRDTETEAAWWVPCHQLTVRYDVVLPGMRTLTITGPQGTVRCAVSREHINRFMVNTLKTIREARQADELRQALLAHGAQP
ncbi:hypothetical protein JK386_13100 [Nocardioides sp. zg-536]|uniref:Uncharacterized protein n=1 Tax=Nocardioides faecalis TaxID=2803858 RepID=A0A939BTN6_9ACTN|nr:hypothetical protein [Nocardioides faecalis]MBM9460839.1 hypothetical protein [Nocardioides faecalis]QVI58027.1 hypothetical protein KG111_13475 [Nocardioides faecalis]